MKKTILLTRPRLASERCATLLKQQGFDCVIEPLLIIEPTYEPRPQGLFQAVLITSVNAPEMLETLKEQITDLLALPCFCVGNATAMAARALGFTNLHYGSTDSVELAHLVVAELKDKTQPLLHIGGDFIGGKTQTLLANYDFHLTSWTVYRAHAEEDLTAPTQKLFVNGSIAAIPIFSPRSARILVSLIEKNKLTRACHKIIAVGLSQAVVDVLKTLPWRRLVGASVPTEEEVFKILHMELLMDDSKTTPSTQASLTKSEKKKKFNFVLISAAILSFFVFGTIVVMPYLQRPVPHSPEVLTTSPIADLEKRVESLEKRAALEDNVTAPAHTDNDLADRVKALQAEVDQIQNKGSQDQQATQKIIIEWFSFLDIEAAARLGRSFKEPLITLRNLMTNQREIIEQLSKLEPYEDGKTPIYKELRTTLMADEATLKSLPSHADQKSLEDRIQRALQSLITVRPLVDPVFTNLENALDAENGVAAQAAFNDLPETTKKILEPWKTNLDARVTIDEALQSLRASLTNSRPQEGSP